MDNKLAVSVQTVLDQEAVLKEEEHALMQNKAFKAFILKQKEVEKNIKEFWSTLEQKMIDEDIRKIEGDWGTVSIVTRTNWDINKDELPNKFFKKVVDTKRVTDTFKLEGKAPKGCTPKYKKYIAKRLK